MYTPTSAVTTLDASQLPVMLKTEQAGAIANVTTKHIRDLAREGAIPAVRVGGTWRIPRDQFLKQFGLA